MKGIYLDLIPAPIIIN